MATFKINIGRYLKWVTICCVISLPLFIGVVHLFDWDEVNFAEIAREMVITKNYFIVQLNYQAFWEKPPLFFWIQTFCMHVFGINEFASRLPNALVGMLSIYVLIYSGKKLFNIHFGYLWALCFACSLLPYFYFKTAIIDPLFNLFIYLCLIQLFYYHQYKKLMHSVFGGLFLGLAFLTKGPVAILIVGLVILFFLLYVKFKIQIKIIHIFLFLIVLCSVCFVWILPELLKGGGVQLFKDFIQYQIRLFTTPDAGHGQPFFYHPVVLFFGCFPISQLAFPYILKIKNKYLQTLPLQQFYALNFILFWVVLILFSITTTKIVHYSSLCYLPLSFIAASYLNDIVFNKQKMSRYPYYLLLVVGVLLGIVFIALPCLIYYKSRWAHLIKDSFAVENILLNVQWTQYEWLIGVLFLSVFIYLMYKIRYSSQYVISLFLCLIVIINLLLYAIVPKIEQHVQGSMIEFFEAHSNEYVATYNFKSYAQFFYSKKMPQENIKAYDINWLLSGDIDKPVFVVAKIFDKEKVLQLPKAQYLYEKGGFVFVKRIP